MASVSAELSSEHRLEAPKKPNSRRLAAGIWQGARGTLGALRFMVLNYRQTQAHLHRILAPPPPLASTPRHPVPAAFHYVLLLSFTSAA